MIFVEPTLDSFTSSNITQTYPDYVPGTTYIYEVDTALTSASVVRYKGYYWRSVAAGNKGNNPEENENTWWVKWEVSNTYAMLDLQALTVSKNTGADIVVEFERTALMDTMGIGYLETSGIKIEYLDENDIVLPEYTQNIDYSVNEGVIDLLTYIYLPKSTQINRSIKINLKRIGSKIRVTIKKNVDTNDSACGFMVPGRGVYMGATLSEVEFDFDSFSKVETGTFGDLSIVKRDIRDTVDFDTLIIREAVPEMRRLIKEIKDKIVMFVIDESDNSSWENAITFGKIENSPISGSVASKNRVSFSVVESI